MKQQIKSIKCNALSRTALLPKKTIRQARQRLTYGARQGGVPLENTILIVDDVRLFLEIQKEFLQYASVNVVTAQNGVEALDAINSKRPNLIFMDLEMPEMDGAVCCRTIKTNPRFADIPVVMITAKGDEASRLMCRAAGCDDFLTKPLNRSLFLETAGRFVADIDRREKRTPIALPGILRSRGTAFPCQLHNLSLGGAFVAAGSFEVETDRTLDISFTLPDGTEHDCRAKVVWFKEGRPGTPPGFGVNFILLPAAIRDALGRFLKTVH